MSGDLAPPPVYVGPSIWEALLAFQAEAPVLPKDNSATVPTKSGGQYSYRYTDLGTIAEQIQPLLHKHGLVWVALPTGTHEQPRLDYILGHAPSGQTITGAMPLFGVDTSQTHGSALTYGRRYAKVAVLDLVADEDDDGAAASARGTGGADPGRDTVDLRDSAKGLRDDAINAARASIGLPKLDKPWASLMNIPAEKSEDFRRALDAARAAS